MSYLKKVQGGTTAPPAQQSLKNESVEYAEY